MPYKNILFKNVYLGLICLKNTFTWYHYCELLFMVSITYLNDFVVLNNPQYHYLLSLIWVSMKPVYVLLTWLHNLTLQLTLCTVGLLLIYINLFTCGNLYDRAPASLFCRLAVSPSVIDDAKADHSLICSYHDSGDQFCT